MKNSRFIVLSRIEPHEYSYLDNSATRGEWQYRRKQIDLDGMEHFTEPINVGMVTSVKEVAPIEFALKQNYPNPFNPTSVIEYALPKQSSVKIEVDNPLRQRKATLLVAVRPAGAHFLEFDASGFSSGLYFYRMTSDGNINLMKKMVLMK